MDCLQFEFFIPYRVERVGDEFGTLYELGRDNVSVAVFGAAFQSVSKRATELSEDCFSFGW